MKPDIESHIASWVDAGVLTAEQSEAIRRFEDDRRLVRPTDAVDAAESIHTIQAASEVTESGRTGSTASGTASFVIEALGYVGGAVIMGALALLLDRYADRIDSPGWIAISVTTAFLLVLAGAGAHGVSGDNTPPAFQRLGAVLWALGTLAVVGAGIAIADAMDVKEKLDFLGVSAVAALVAAVLWWRRPSALQHVVAFIAGLFLVSAAVVFFELDSSTGWIGLAFAAYGIIWLLFAWAERLVPIAVGYAFGSAALLIGLQVLAVDGIPGFDGGSDADRTLAAAVAVAAAVVLGILGVAQRRVSLVASGAVGLVILLPQLAQRVLGDSLGVAFALLLSGIALIGGAVLIAQLRRQW